MRPQALPSDTDGDVFRRQVERWRSMTPVERLQLADRLSTDVVMLAVASIRFEQPDATPDQVSDELARRRFGVSLVEAIRGSVSPR